MSNPLYREIEHYKPKVSLFEAQAFLHALCERSDALQPNAAWNFLSVRESELAHRSTWPEESYENETLNSVGYRLEARNSRTSGCGSFIQVNTQDQIRAVWRSNADSTIGSAFRLQPSWVSSVGQGQWIALWFTSDDWSNDEAGKADFELATERHRESITAFHRLPGFWSYHGTAPFLVRSIHKSQNRYSRDRILAALARP